MRVGAESIESEDSATVFEDHHPLPQRCTREVLLRSMRVRVARGRDVVPQLVFESYGLPSRLSCGGNVQSQARDTPRSSVRVAVYRADSTRSAGHWR